IHDGLAGRVEPRMLQRYLSQRGMFTYTGLGAEQVETLRRDQGVYLLRSGRMCVAGLNRDNVAVAADAIASVLARG
ncbi:aminotransferase class I/II-fold pyridoxal phosphate-dependent enzyme, partial [Bordetella pertussis]